MHASSLEQMSRLVGTYLQDRASLSVVDIGAFDVNGSYRPLFDRAGWTYTGIDLEAGPGVDVVLESPYRYPLENGSVDLVVSGQAFEHVEYFWLTWLEMLRVIRDGGMIFLIAPSRGPEHRYPQDCWRFYPDGYRALARYGGCELVEVHTHWGPHPDPDSDQWGDTVGVFRKIPMRWKDRLTRAIVRRALGKMVETP